MAASADGRSSTLQINGFWVTDAGGYIYDSKAPMTHDAALKWLEDRCKAGVQVVGIDPVTMLESGERQWQDDQRFVTKARRMIEDAGARLILVAHPRTGSKGQSELENVAGGAAYTRFVDTVLWLQAHEPARQMRVGVALGGTDIKAANRTLRIRKARDGRGAGWTVAMDFCGRSTTFRELGIVVNP